MEVRFTCVECQQPASQELLPSTEVVACARCGASHRVPAEAFADGQPVRCVVCPCRELFYRRDFDQRWGVSIVVIGFALATVAWAFHKPLWTYATLFATAAIDMVLYFLVGNVVECYRCHAQYRGLESERYEAFELETHERFRQEAARVDAATASTRRDGQESLAGN